MFLKSTRLLQEILISHYSTFEKMKELCNANSKVIFQKKIVFHKEGMKHDIIDFKKYIHSIFVVFITHQM